MTSREWNHREDIAKDVRVGVERAIELFRSLDLHEMTEERLRTTIALMDGPVETASMLGSEERFRYREFRSFQLILDFLTDELYPPQMPHRLLKMNILHIGYLRGMLAKEKDKNPQNSVMIKAVTDSIDTQIEKLYHHPDIKNFTLP